jgi:hypothetical protein
MRHPRSGYSSSRSWMRGRGTRIGSIGAARMSFVRMGRWIRFVGTMRMRDVENRHSRRMWIALAWSLPTAITLSPAFLTMLKRGGQLFNWVPNVGGSLDWMEAILSWIFVTIASSGFLAVDTCRWHHRLSQNSFPVLILALAFFFVHSLIGFAVIHFAYGSLENALPGGLP